MILTEARVGSAWADNIDYPNINSCLTITCVCDGGFLSGGHAVALPPDLIAEFHPAQQGVPPGKTLDQIVTYIQSRTLFRDRRYLFLIGDDWERGYFGQVNPAAEYDSFRAIANALGLANRFTSVVVSEILPPGRNAYVRVRPNGIAEVYENVHIHGQDEPDLGRWHGMFTMRGEQHHVAPGVLPAGVE